MACTGGGITNRSLPWRNGSVLGTGCGRYRMIRNAQLRSFRPALALPESSRPFRYGPRMLPVAAINPRSLRPAARPRCEGRRIHRRF